MLVLLGLFFFYFLKLLMPDNDFKLIRQATTFADGDKISDIKSAKLSSSNIKVKTVDKIEKRESNLNIENIKIKEEEDSVAQQKILQSDPLLQNNSLQIIEYTVRSGDTLEGISRKFYGSSKELNLVKLKTSNKITNSRRLRVGQKLTIPF